MQHQQVLKALAMALKGLFYTLERTADLMSDSWIGVPDYSNILGSGQSVICTLPATNPSPTFFRGRVEWRGQ